MRNLKKVLSLVLCMAMMLSVMVVGAGAAFSDQSKIKNTEAVDMCVALNIINGYTDGSFKPEGNITRAEACKMICVALNGGKDPVLPTKTTPTFSDVRSTSAKWAEGYIESCVAQGIVAGIGGGKFNPNGNVTGSQFAKMLLIALGYNADTQGYTGAPWEVNVNVDAFAKGLYAGLTGMDPAKALSRDSAAQMIWNALQAYEVEYKYNLITENGQLVSKVVLQDKVVGSNNDKITLMYDKYDRAQEVDGRLTSFSYDSNKGEWTYTITARNSSSTKVGEFTSKQDYTDLYMQNVTAVFNYENKKDSTKVDTFYGMYADESVVLASGIVGDLDTVSDDAKKIKLDGTEYKTEKTLANISVYAFNTGALKGLEDLSKLEHASSNNAATSVKLIDWDNNGKVDVAVIVPTTVEKVTYVGPSRVTAGQSYKFEDCNIYKGIAKDDFALIVKADYTAKDEDTLTKADSVKGEVTGVKGGDQIRVDGIWYTLAGQAKMPEVGDTVAMAVVGDFAYDVDTTVGASKDILLITANDAADTDLNKDYTVDARAYFPDGTNKKITIDKISMNPANSPADITGADVKNGGVGKNDLANTLFTYSKDKDGNYELRILGDKNLAGADSYTTGTYDASKDTIGGKKIADDAVIFVVANDKIKVQTGKTVKDWSTNTTATVKGALIDEVSNMNYVTYAALVVNGDQPSASGDLLYAYLTADCYKTKLDGDNVTAYEVWNGSKDVILYEDSTSHAGAFKEGTAIAYREDGSFITDVKKLDAYAITGFDGKSEGDIDLLKDGGTGNATGYTLDKDCVVIAMDDDAVKGLEGSLSSVSTAQKNAVNAYIPNAYIAFDDGKVIAIIYDVNGELDEYSYMDKDTQFSIPETVSDSFTSNLTYTITRDGNKITVRATDSEGTFSRDGDQYILSADGNQVATGTKINDGKTITFTFTATKNIKSLFMSAK